MSDKERQRDDNGGGRGGDDEDGESAVVSTEFDGPIGKKCRGCGEMGERVSLFRFRKRKKLLHSRRKEKGIYVKSVCWWKRGNVSRCCLCLKQPRTLDSSDCLIRNCKLSQLSFSCFASISEKLPAIQRGASKHRMRKGSRKMWWVVHCRSKKNLRPESRMGIEEILKMKLETIKEEPEIKEENGALRKQRIIMSRKVKKIHLKMKMGWIFTSQLSLKESYVLFMTGLSSKGGLSGLPRY